MNTRLTPVQKDEIFGSWKYFEDSLLQEEVNDLKKLTIEQVKEIYCHAGSYESLAHDNKDHIDLDLNVQRAWAGFERSMISLQKKCEIILDL